MNGIQFYTLIEMVYREVKQWLPGLLGEGNVQIGRGSAHIALLKSRLRWCRVGCTAKLFAADGRLQKGYQEALFLLLLARNGAKLLVKLQKRCHPSPRVHTVCISTGPRKKIGLQSYVCIIIVFVAGAGSFQKRIRNLTMVTTTTTMTRINVMRMVKKRTTSSRRRMRSFRKP